MGAEIAPLVYPQKQTLASALKRPQDRTLKVHSLRRFSKNHLVVSAFRKKTKPLDN